MLQKSPCVALLAVIMFSQVRPKLSNKYLQNVYTLGVTKKHKGIHSH